MLLMNKVLQRSLPSLVAMPGGIKSPIRYRRLPNVAHSLRVMCRSQISTKINPLFQYHQPFKQGHVLCTIIDCIHYRRVYALQRAVAIQLYHFYPHFDCRTICESHINSHPPPPPDSPSDQPLELKIILPPSSRPPPPWLRLSPQPPLLRYTSTLFLHLIPLS